MPGEIQQSRVGENVVWFGVIPPLKRYIDRVVRTKKGVEMRALLTTEALAEKFDITPELLKRTFYTWSKGTPSAPREGIPLDRYVENRITVRAAELLAQTDLPVRDIARQLGYAHASGITPAFRAHFKQSPREFRKLSRL